MFAKVKYPVFIDTVKFELLANHNSLFKALLRDEHGSVCSMMETTLPCDSHEFTWNGLNALPYGVYTLELTRGDDEIKLQMVKRV